jgi:hypothetical protein
VRALHTTNPAWPVAGLCQTLAVPRSGLYYRPHQRDEAPLKQAIQATAGAWPRYGFTRLRTGSERVAAHVSPPR